MSWLPRIRLQGTCIAERHWEAEGWLVQLQLGRLVLELTVARKDREFPDEPGE